VQQVEDFSFRGGFSGQERDVFFHNVDGRDAFVEIAYSLGLDFADDGRSFAPVDIDGDGDLDIAHHSVQQLRLLENATRPRHFARVHLRATKTQHHAIGAKVIVTAGGVRQQDYVKICAGFQTQVPLDLHFGLGDAPEIDKLEVDWPSGSKQEISHLPVDRLLEIDEGAEPRISSLRRWSQRTQKAPRFALTAKGRALDGKEVDLGSFGAPLLVNFWAPWCKPCTKELPELVALAKRFQKSISFVGVSVETEDRAAVGEAIARHHLVYPQLYATPALLASFFGTQGEAPLPATFVFDKEGQLRRMFDHPIGAKEVDPLLESLKDEPVHVEDLVQLGRYHLDRKEWADALPFFKAAVDARPDDPDLLSAYGTLLMRTGRSREASAPLHRAERLRKKSPKP
jgi:thiol-disulfide isomerase/thioredoxin